MKELDSILIELEVFAVQDGINVWMQGKLLINVNMMKPYGESDIVNAEALFESVKQDGAYHIFSCCCGMPACSGWIEKMHITTEGEVLKWTDPNNNKTWYFDKNIILTQVASIKEEVAFFKEYFKKKDIDYVGVGYAW